VSPATRRLGEPHQPPRLVIESAPQVGPPAITALRPSELFVSRLNAVADTDVSALLRCRDVVQRDAAVRALGEAARSPPVEAIGRRARAIEPVRRTPERIASRRCQPPVRLGPIDVALVEDDERELFVRWSHLAGDARTFQAFVTGALDSLEPIDDAYCRCATFAPGAARPMTPADAWASMRSAGRATAATAIAALPASFGPFARPLRPALGGQASAPRTEPGGDAEATAVFRLANGAIDSQGASRFASATAVVVAGIARLSSLQTVRVGITVDVRRHQPLDLAHTAGNLSAVGHVNVAGGDVDAVRSRLHRGIQRLIARAFWQQQYAFDAWVGRLFPAAVQQRNFDLIVGRLATVSPLVVTELWRDDRPVCAACGQRRRGLPAGMSVVAIPPAIPADGLTCGISRDAAGTTLVLRRVTRSSTPARTWLEALVDRGGLGPAEPDVVSYRQIDG
jgi:hypothetical protein